VQRRFAGEQRGGSGGLAAATGCFHPSTSPCEDLSPTGLFRFIGDLSQGVATPVSLVDSQVKGSLSAHPSRYRRSRPVLQFNLLFVVGLHWTKLRVKALPGYGVSVSNNDVLECREPPWRCLLGCFMLGL
jgi:hypothetical protein